jgi:hypothetical protein
MATPFDPIARQAPQIRELLSLISLNIRIFKQAEPSSNHLIIAAGHHATYRAQSQTKTFFVKKIHSPIHKRKKCSTIRLY